MLGSLLQVSAAANSCCESKPVGAEAERGAVVHEDNKWGKCTHDLFN